MALSLELHVKDSCPAGVPLHCRMGPVVITLLHAEVRAPPSLVLWECFIRSGGKSRVGYIKRVKDMWDGISQIKQIGNGDGITVVEREAIEKFVRDGEIWSFVFVGGENQIQEETALVGDAVVQRPESQEGEVE